MNHEVLDRSKLTFFPLAERPNRVDIRKQADDNHVASDQSCGHDFEGQNTDLESIAARIVAARGAQRPVILAFGAHTIKNGLGPTLTKWLRNGWITHLATNGAGVIHDWELAFQGQTSEDVAAHVSTGRFGLWRETGEWINLALLLGAWRGLGYGESVGALIADDGLKLPSPDILERDASDRTDAEKAAAAIDLSGAMKEFNLSPGLHALTHNFKQLSLQAAAYRMKIPFTAHPMFGHDIIYTHPWNHGAAIGRTALRDFLSFAHSVSRIEDGVYLSVGSAVMSPMIFEKAFSMAQNLALQNQGAVKRHFIAVVDLAESRWNWKRDGEPPTDRPEYYLRFCKSFSRMGGQMAYIQMDNRSFFRSLEKLLEAAL